MIDEGQCMKLIFRKGVKLLSNSEQL
jgi:hypothetical protein